MTTLIRPASISPFAFLPEPRALARPGRHAAVGLALLGLLALHVAHQAQSPYAALDAGAVQDEATWAARFDAPPLSCPAAKACPLAPYTYEN
jgi:hypothetical protein